jgi:hypothetical protein
MGVQKLVYGITAVKLGTPTDLATMPVSLDAFSETVKGSFTLQESEPTTIDAETEESVAPIGSITDKEAVLEGTWKTYDYTPDMLAMVKGGTATAAKWVAPAAPVNIEKALQITTTVGAKLNVFKAKITARFTGVMSKAGFSEIEIKFKALSPATGLAPYEWDALNL